MGIALKARIEEAEAASPELVALLREIRDKLLTSNEEGSEASSLQAFDNDSQWWQHLEVVFVLRAILVRLQNSLEEVALGAPHESFARQLEKCRLLEHVKDEFEKTTAERLEGCVQPPKAVMIERRYGLSPAESEIFRMLVIKDSLQYRSLRQYFKNGGGRSMEFICDLCSVTAPEVLGFMQESRQYVTEGIVVLKDDYFGVGDQSTREVSVAAEVVRALRGYDLTSEQQLKISGTVAENVLNSGDWISTMAAGRTPAPSGDSLDMAANTEELYKWTQVGIALAASIGAGNLLGSPSAGDTVTAEQLAAAQGLGHAVSSLLDLGAIKKASEAEADDSGPRSDAAGQEAAAAAPREDCQEEEDGEKVAQSEATDGEAQELQPYRESLDYLNDQFNLLECDIHIAEHRRQTTTKDAGAEEPSFMRAKKVNVFEFEAKRRLAFARISHRLQLTHEAGLDVPRLESLIQKKKFDDFEKNVLILLIGQTLSPKIQATLSSQERRFCREDSPPQVKMILQTFCRDFKEEVQKRVYFYKSSRLVRSGIIRVHGGYRSGDLTNHSVQIDRRILDYVVGLDTEINEVVDGSNFYKPTISLDQLVLSEDMKESILTLVCNFEKFRKYRKSAGLDDMVKHGAGLVLMFCGPSGTGKTLMANALAARLDKHMLLVNFKTLSGSRSNEDDSGDVLKLFREAEMNDAVLFFDECESLFTQRGKGGSAEMTSLLTAMERHEGVIFLATNRPFDLDEAMYRRITSVFSFSKPDHTQRLQIWKLYTQDGVPVSPGVSWDKIAMKYALTGGYIRNAIVSALLLAISRDSESPTVTETDIHEACTMQVQGSLQMQSFSKRVVPKAGLDKLVLSTELRAQLSAIVSFEKARPLLLETWGFGVRNHITSQGSMGKQSTTALLWGAAGTGKSAAAEALGFELSKALKIVNFSDLEVTNASNNNSKDGVSSIEAVFLEAKSADAVLVIDGISCSVLCGRESSNERMVRQLTFHIERFPGVVLLLATSDDALEQQQFQPELSRLLKFSIVFDRPPAEQRAEMWRSSLPKRTPLAENIDFDVLGQLFEITADGIASAAFRAAASAVLRDGEERKVSMQDLREAGEIEARSAEASDSRSGIRVSLNEYLRGYKHERHKSFHDVYVLTDERDKRSWKSCSKVCWRLDMSDLGKLFMPILTLDGIEGSYPEMFDAHPRDLGLCFTLAANGKDVLLVEAQEKLGKHDVESSMYSSTTGGMRRGYITSLTPVAHDGDHGLLVDMTAWLKMFSSYFSGNADHTHLLETRAFENNFLFRFSTQEPSHSPIKEQAKGLTVYYTVAFITLPQDVMMTRPSDPRVGYFTSPVFVGGPQQATTVQHVVNRWNLQRRQHLLYVIDASVPSVYHQTIKDAVLAWNAAFEACLGRAVMKCVAPSEDGYPAEYIPGDGRHITISMTNPSQKGLLGYGPSAVDYRSGEILMASVVLGFKSHIEHASRFSMELLTHPGAKRAGCPCLLDANAEDVLRNLLLTTVHEVGHTLGLRHNFIAAEDGHSSVMDYIDELDTSDPGRPVFGGRFLTEPGRYDVYAIRYAYSQLQGEVRGQRHQALDLLANGQAPDDAALSQEPRNPLFASDEDLGGIDPRVQRHGADAARMGADKVEWALEQRRILLEHVRAGQIDCDLYSQRLLGALRVAVHAVQAAAGFIGGGLVDAQRTRVTPCCRGSGLDFVRVVLQVLIGPIFRLGQEEVEHLLQRKEGTYGVQPASVLSLHMRCCEALLTPFLAATTLMKVEAQRAACSGDSSELGSVSELLAALFFGQNLLDGAVREKVPERGLLHPLSPNLTELAPLTSELEAAAADALSSQARLTAARLLNGLARGQDVHALVQAQARAVISAADVAAKGIHDLDGLNPVAREHWGLLLEVLKKKSRRDKDDSDD